MNENKEQVMIPVEKLHPFAGHPYMVIDNEEMNSLIESIQEQGILSPLIVKPLEKTADEYEIISGHRRFRAAEKAGMKEVPALILPLDRDAAAIAVVDSNLHREHIFPSVKAFAYKLKMEALSHQGTSCQVGTKSRSDEIMAETADESARQIQRYIRLTHLLPEILEYVDDGKMALTPAVELSYLTEQEQWNLLEQIEINDCTPSLSQACRMKKLSQGGELSPSTLSEIMCEEKANQKEKVSFKTDELRGFFPKSYTTQEIQKAIMQIIEADYRRRQRSRDDGAR